MINDEQLDKFIGLCENSGFTISREEALADAIRLINLVKLVYQPMTKDELEAVQNRRSETRDLVQIVGTER